MNINFELKKARLQQGISQWKLAHEIGLYPQRLSLIEQGRLVPSQELQNKIAKVLGTKVENLFK